jgi:two-component system, OmpR family, response regulator
MSGGEHVLIVERDHGDRVALATYLERNGYFVTAVTSSTSMRRALQRVRLDAVLLGLAPRGEDALRLCRRVRELSDVPVIMLMQHAEAVDRIVALEIGADDQLSKPYNPRELLARLRNVLRRALVRLPSSRISPGTVFRFDGWQLDTLARELRDPDGRRVALREAEFRVLATLLAHGNGIVSRTRLMELASPRNPERFERTIDVRVSHLRQVLRDDAKLPRIIKTVYGEGYVIGVPIEATERVAS